ncbi:MAG: methyltransferase domain-containing protein [Anaerolineae bacterium]|nr:methyltransferase domain-containing protein [Anaerolineae bacterium]
MDLVAFYDDYWRQADDTFDHERLELLASRVRPGERVLEVDCGPGVLAAKMRDRGAQVQATEISLVAAERARAKGIPTEHVNSEVEPLPFPDDAFDVVVSNSMIEHRFFYEHSLDECVRVLRPGGRLLVCLPNIAHWKCRLWVLRGRFPYVKNSPTDFLHLRFFTVAEARRLLQERGVQVVEVDGSASLWAREFYGPLFRWPPVRRVYTYLAHRFPSLFARDFVVVGVKRGRPARGGAP